MNFSFTWVSLLLVLAILWGLGFLWYSVNALVDVAGIRMGALPVYLFLLYVWFRLTVHYTAKKGSSK